MSKLSALCEKLNIKAASVYGAVKLLEGWERIAHPYKVTLYKGKRQLTVPFFMGAAHTREPTAADVLACLTSDARAGELTFEQFCDEFDHDSDSRKTEATWKACVKLAPRLRRFLGEDFEAVSSAEH